MEQLEAKTKMPTRSQKIGQSTSGDALVVRGLFAGYGGHMIVRNVSFSLARGEMVGLVGRNGSGKSTILLGLLGLTESRSDEIKIGNNVVTRLAPHQRIRRGVSIQLQRNGVFPDLSIGFHLDMAKVQWDDVESQIATSETLVQHARRIVNRRRTLAGRLSGGERRILAMVMALGRSPLVLLADEPALGLTSDLEKDVFRALRAYVSELGRTVLVVSHNLTLISRTCDRTLIVAKGMITDEFSSGDSDRKLEQLV